MVLALGAAPEFALALGVQQAETRVRFDISLVGGRGAEAALDHLVGLGKPGVDIAVAEFPVTRHVFREAFGNGFIGAPGLNDRRAGLHRLVDVGDMGQHFVIHDDLLQRSEGGAGRGRGDGGDGMSVIKRLLAGEDVLAHVAKALIAGIRQVGLGDNGLDARHGQGAGDIDRPDAGMGVRAAQDHAVQHARRAHVGAVLRLAGDFLDTVGTPGPGADDAEFAFLHSIIRHGVLPSSLRRRFARP